MSDLFDGSDAGAAGHSSEVHFGSRWEGVDQWGEPVQQSSLCPPTTTNTGAEVSPNNVTWNH